MKSVSDCTARTRNRRIGRVAGTRRPDDFGRGKQDDQDTMQPNRGAAVVF
jgi:hypothetical protein